MATLEIDGKKVEAPNGSMIIQAADDAGVYIPRFCYHKKLSIAANCRMCLVQVGEGKKPMPACATPIAEGMKIYTKSKVALDAQKAVMEFLLINHPLDCPICDQGGQCELQDLSMGFGATDSRYNEGKRSVSDKNLGPLIATEMTRCIHCTRCVRFSREIAGTPELGMTNRGEHSEITTYVEKALESEVSGNMIDVCPVGALTAKPSRFTSRPWELQQRDAIAPHDCLGSNIHVQVRRNEVMKVTPKVNEAINEVWLSDRDRFSYEGLMIDRVTKPMIKKEGEWKTVTWESALEFVTEGLQKVLNNHSAEQLGALISPSATVEEMYLLQKLLHGVGGNNIDYRLHRIDFSDQAQEGLNLVNIADLETLDACLLVGSTIQKEIPLASLRLRKMVKKGGHLFSLTQHRNGCDTMPVSESIVDYDMVGSLAMLAKALGATDKIFAKFNPTVAIKIMAEKIKASKNFAIVLGQLALNHVEAAKIKGIAQHITELLHGKLLIFTEGANSTGAVLVGIQGGLDTQQMFAKKLKAYILFGVEPELDCANPAQAITALNNAEFTIAITPFITETMLEYSKVILPATPFTEMSGTFINIQGDWQSFNATVPPFAESRPGWKILRVIGNFLKVPNFDYDSSQEVRDELHAQINQQKAKSAHYQLPAEIKPPLGLQRVAPWMLYRIDNIVRRAVSLQATPKNIARVMLNSKTANSLGLLQQERVLVTQNNTSVELPLKISEKIADNCVFVPSGFPETAVLGTPSGEIEVSKC